jgi:hypothetical protein
MEDAVWAVIGDSVPYLAGILLAVYIISAIYVTLLEGLRVDRWAIFARKGVMRGLTDERKT